MGVDRHEPVFQIFKETKEYKLYKENFEKVGWITFLEKFRGYHDKLSHAFAQNFGGEIVWLGKMTMQVTKTTIVEATGLSPKGEKYFKGMTIDRL